MRPSVPSQLACLLTTAATTLASSVALAATPVDVQLVGQVLAGKKPQVVVVAHTTVKNVRLDLTRSGCGAGEVHQTLPKIAGGRSARFDLDQPEGRCHYEGMLEAVIGGEVASMPLSFSAEVAAAPEVKPAADALDANAHTVKVTFNREADHGVVEAYGEGGQLLSKTETALAGAAAGEVLTLGYQAPSGTPLRLQINVFDASGLYGGVALYPWSLRIPHQEIDFPSGSSDVLASEAPKLADSVSKIQAALAKVGIEVPVRLFVVGYTDTVGSTASNQALSEARARSIASWFRVHGIRLPVLTAGLGEEALAVPTPDETAEARNRRAEYILSVDSPPIDRAPRQPVWQPLR
jgi:outer membrane protein OmpA-like peptidoglycan-associated protein